MKTVTFEQIGVVLGIVATAIVVWKAALAQARSTLLAKIEERMNRAESRLNDHEADIDRNTERTDKLYDRLIQKNS